MARLIDVDEFAKHMENLADKAHAEGYTNAEVSFRMAILQIELYATTFGVKEIE